MDEVSTKTLPDVGSPIDMGQIRAEVGGSGQVSLNDPDFRALISKNSGEQQSLYDYYGKGGMSQALIDDWNEYARNNSLGLYPYSGDTQLTGSPPYTYAYYDVNPLREAGTMEGSPRNGRSGNTNVRGGALYNRIIQHMVESYDEFKFLVDNGVSVMLTYLQASGLTNMLGENFNGFQSTDFTAYGTGYYDWIVIWLAPDGTVKKRWPTGEVTQVNWSRATIAERRLFVGAKKFPGDKPATQEILDE